MTQFEDENAASQNALEYEDPWGDQFEKINFDLRIKDFLAGIQWERERVAKNRSSLSFTYKVDDKDAGTSELSIPNNGHDDVGEFKVDENGDWISTLAKPIPTQPTYKRAGKFVYIEIKPPGEPAPNNPDNSTPASSTSTSEPSE